MERLLFERLYGGTEGVDVLLRRGPARAEAHAGVRLVDALPVFIAEALTELGEVAVREDGLLLVGGGVEQQGIARRDEDLADLVRHVDGVA